MSRNIFPKGSHMLHMPLNVRNGQRLLNVYHREKALCNWWPQHGQVQGCWLSKPWAQLINFSSLHATASTLKGKPHIQLSKPIHTTKVYSFKRKTIPVVREPPVARDKPIPNKGVKPHKRLSKTIHTTKVYCFSKENHTCGSRPACGSRQTDQQHRGKTTHTALQTDPNHKGIFLLKGKPYLWFATRLWLATNRSPT